VPGIVSHLDPILEDLEREAYAWRAYLVPASAVYAPHKRERIWIVAHRDSIRCNVGSDNRQERHFQDDWQWHIETIQPEWTQFVPEPWKTMQVEGWIALNTHASRIDDGLPNRVDRIKSIGNAIVPQVVYPIMKIIYEIENEHS
jgi:DNA (cytosine-5)-methyltransferase 1